MRRPVLSPYLSSLPGSGQRLRALRVMGLAVLVLVLRPWVPFSWLPGWVVGGLLLWALLELCGWV
ncbi:MAG: hypothetical protein R6U00_10205 [Prochlorococcaceae cyanobacterium]